MHKFMRKAARALNIGIDKVLPDAFVLAIALGVIAFFMCLIWTDSGVIDLMVSFGDGFWNFLLFGMQMLMIVTTGYMLASAPVVKRILKKICKLPKTPVQGALFVSIISCIIGFFNWGLGLVAGAFIARYVALNLRTVDFKMLVATAYIGGAAAGTIGISGSEFLLINTPGWFMESTIGLIPLSETVFSVVGLICGIGSFLVIVPLLVWLMHPSAAETLPLDPSIRATFEAEEAAEQQQVAERKPWKEMTFAEKADNWPVLVYAICVFMVVYLVKYFIENGFNLTINITNLLVLTIAMLLHGKPSSIIRAAESGVKSAFGVALQFPFYGGIQGMMGASGMVSVLANAFVGISTVGSFPVISYIYGAILNIFIPSSGGIFMVAGPSLAEAAASLGTAHSHWIFGFTYGEGLSNIIQPFWAIPLLGLCNMRMKDIMGYCIIFFLATSALVMLTMGIAW